MALFSVADIVTAIFLLVTVFDAVQRRDERESSKALTLTMIVSVVLVLLDSLSGFVYPASTPDAVLYIAEVFTTLATKGIMLFFLYYCYQYFRERTAVSKWLFIVPMALLALNMTGQAVWIFSDGFMTVNGGAVIATGSFPKLLNLLSFLLALYLPVLAVIERKNIGTRAMLCVGSFNIFLCVLPFVGLHDYTSSCAGCIVFITYVLLQNGIYNQQEREQQILEESKAELESLNTQLEEVTTEQEAQIEEISALNVQLEENQAELEASSEEQAAQLREINELNTEMLLILKSMADTYYSMHLINLVDDTMVDYKSQNEVKEIADHPQGAAKMMADVIKATATDEYRDAMLTFTDLTTIRERMNSTKILTSEFIGKRLGWTRMSFITVKSDRNGMPLEVMCVTRCIETEKQKEEILIRESNTDALTKLMNRRAFETELNAENTVFDDLVYIAFDVNGLKYVNDHLGHAAGDELLIGAADCMRKSFGKYGRIFRTGGDEFAAIIHISADELEKTRNAFESLVSHWSGKIVSELHIAAGYAAAPERGCGNLQQMSILADKRMYADKAEYYKQSGIDRRKR